MRPSCRLLSVSGLLVLLLYAGIGTEASLTPDPEPEGSLSGQLLVAAPELADPNFQETVVYLVQHDRSGAVGLVINRLLGAGPLDRVLDGLGLAPGRPSEIELRVHYGGPVEPARPLDLADRAAPAPKRVQLPVKQGPSAEIDQALGPVVGQVPQARALASGKNDRLFHQRGACRPIAAIR
jgi:hypothetical protein